MATKPAPYPGEDRRAPEPESWHLDKKVPLTLIFAIMVQTAMVIVAFADVKKDVEVLKTQVLTQRDRDERQDQTVANSVLLLRQALDKIDTKLDRLVENRGLR